MEKEWTCGKGVAAAALLPEKLSALITALADTLELHRHALDLEDPGARAEDEGYAAVIARQRAAAEALQAASHEMATLRDLPMGRHDEATMNDSALMAPYTRFIELQQELVEMMQASVREGEAT